jgi:uncharacterized membrane protein YeiH
VTVSVIRSILAVLAGYAVFAVGALLVFGLSGQKPHADASAGFKTLAIVAGTAFAITGGYLAAMIAKSSPVAHSTALGALVASIAAWSIHASPVKDPIWSQVSAIFFMAPGGILGGVLRSLQRDRD